MLNGFRGNITSLISRLGRAVVVRTKVNSGTSFNPVQANVDVPSTAVIFDYESSEIDGTIIQKHDKLIVLDGTNILTKNDFIVDNGVEYAIISIEEVVPGAQGKLMHVVQGRA